MTGLISRFGPTLFALIILAACGQLPMVIRVPSDQVLPPQESGRPTRERGAFIEHLRSRGLAVEIIGGSRSGDVFLRPRGTLLCVGGGAIAPPEPMEVFVYKSAREAEADLNRIDPDGSTSTSTARDGSGSMLHVEWVRPPHFFRSDRIIVLYLGDNQGVLRLLTEVLGSQVAGAGWDAHWGLADPTACHDLVIHRDRVRALTVVTLATVVGMAFWITFQFRHYGSGT